MGPGAPAVNRGRRACLGAAAALAAGALAGCGDAPAPGFDARWLADTHADGHRLREVRVCLSKDLREFRSCPEVARSSCRTREIDVPGPL